MDVSHEGSGQGGVVRALLIADAECRTYGIDPCPSLEELRDPEAATVAR